MGNRIRIIQIGMGNFGSSWFREVLPQVPEAEVAGIVSRRPEFISTEYAFPADRIYTDLDAAADALKPDLVFVVTPPATHAGFIRTAVKKGIPVLCEKPLTDSGEELRRLRKELQSASVPVVVSENYRYMRSMRRCAEILQTGSLGSIAEIDVDFFRSHSYSPESYLARMAHPMLMDVSIHHFDCMRFLTGQEVQSVSASAGEGFADPDRRNAAADVELRMRNGIRVVYHGSLNARENRTDWLGDWTFRCEKGTLRRTEGEIRLNIGADCRTEKIADDEPESRKSLLLDVLEMLHTGKPAQTGFEDNLHTTLTALAAAESFDQNGKRIEPGEYEDLI